MSVDPLATAIGMLARLEATQREYAQSFQSSGQTARGEAEAAVADELARMMANGVARLNQEAPKANGEVARLVEVGGVKKNGASEATIVAARRVLSAEGKMETS